MMSVGSRNQFQIGTAKLLPTEMGGNIVSFEVFHSHIVCPPKQWRIWAPLDIKPVITFPLFYFGGSLTLVPAQSVIHQTILLHVL